MRRPSDRMFMIINGEPILSVDGLSLLIDVPVAEIKAEAARQGIDVQVMVLPAAWERQGRRIAVRLAVRGIGRGDIPAALDFLAAERARRDGSTVARAG
ncbi:hypothetical protein RB614_40480 [Phytohabitans sp. ZYX-F-186]|uniref:Uncharacterized protein n=1 Tax=Phytohabitans maris TaxID=3071409 RepID=A0ABU0ZWA7_9ACTN|nr:hypothetical protein [Phytohabitans sp. ZYX-F-186]MDQ7910787.1 hypothetical protein [Phytohabitans sp. ZYX-F-186]